MPFEPAPPPAPQRKPPAGVPRWLWPPPGAVVRRVVLRESWREGGASVFEVLEGQAPEPPHWNALTWLLHDHDVGERPASLAYEGVVVLEIARTELAGGRVGHAYAMDGGPMGAPSGGAARGLLLRYAAFALGR